MKNKLKEMGIYFMSDRETIDHVLNVTDKSKEN